MRTLYYAVALAATTALTGATPLPDVGADTPDTSPLTSSAHPVAQVTKEPPKPAMVQETIPANHWVTGAKARKNLEAYDNFLMNQPRVNVSLYAMSRCPDAVRATPCALS